MKRLNLIPIFILIAVGILTYFPSLHAQLFWDDDDFIRQNNYVRSFQIGKFFTTQAVEGAGKVSNYFRPLQFTLYAVLYKLWGANAFPYHALSVFLHIAAALTVFLFFLLLTKKQLPSFLTSLIFLIHPVQTEAVTYASGMSDPLVTLFGFLSLIFFLLFLQKQTDHTPKQSVGQMVHPKDHVSSQLSSSHLSSLTSHLSFYLSSLLFFILALLSKETGLTFAVLAMMLSFFLSRQRGLLVRLIPFFPFYIISVIYLLYHKMVIEVVDMATLFGKSAYTDSILIRIETFIANFPTYVQLLMFPRTLHMERDFTAVILKNSMPLYLILFALFVAGSFIVLYAFRHITPHGLLFFLCFLVSWIPFSGIALINGIMYEHYLYLPLIFFFAFFFFLIPIKYKAIFVPVIGIIAALCIARSWSRQGEWQDPVRFYTQTLIYAPKSVRVHNNLAMSYMDQGKREEARQEYEKAITLSPTIPNAYHNLGNWYYDTGDYAAAEPFFRKAIEVDPQFGYSYVALLKLYTKTGDKAKQAEIVAAMKKNFNVNPEVQ